MFELSHTHNSHLGAAHNGRPLFTYTYLPKTDPFETPKPHLHPVRTLAGNLVTVYRPHDHLWHHGIAMTFAHISNGQGPSQNFWGGNSYTHPDGYKRIPEQVGRQLHQSWERLDCDPTKGIHLRHRVQWVSYSGEPWIDETRSLSLTALAEAGADGGHGGWWALDFSTSLTSVSSNPLVFGSPTTHGRPNAGYGGLFWRGPRSFMKGEILAAGGLAGPDTMGQSAPWAAYVGRHDGTDGPPAAQSASVSRSTLVFVDQPDSFRYPTKWFLRDEPYGCASFAVTFDAEHTVQKGESFNLHHRIVVADGALSRAQIEALARPAP